MEVNKLAKLVVATVFLNVANTQAAGFALIEHSASGMGNAFAGGGAVAEDASTVYFNPAGMTYVQGTQLVGAIHFIKPNAEFNNDGSIAGDYPGPAPARPLGNSGGDIGSLNFVPNIYFKMDLNENVKIGLGVNSPFGLKTEYDPHWLGRFLAIKSEIQTININPSIAYKINNQLSVGAGISAMWAQAELTRAVNIGLAESDVKIKGDDWGYGYNFGAIYQATPGTRISVAYRSKVNQHLEGDATFGSALLAKSGSISANTTLPETLSMSAFSRIGNQWDLMGDVTFTRWSQFKELRINYSNGTLLANTPENWSNTLRYSIGANYHYNDAIKLRGGLAYDEEAISDQFRTARIPGNDRKWVSMGANWKIQPNASLDIGYAHLFINDATVSDNQVASGSGLIKGSYDGDVNILSLQYTHNF